MTKCNFYWGSHGCSLDAGDHRIHQCGTYWEEHFDIDYEEMVDADICCQYDEDADEDHRVRHASFENDEDWSEWGPYSDGWYQEPHKFASGGLVQGDMTIPVYIERGYIIPSYAITKNIDWLKKINEWKTKIENGEN